MDLTDSQRGIVESAMQAEGIPGLAVAIVSGREVSAAAGFGWRNLESRSRVTPDTVFPICSLTKSMTATAVMQQVEQGKLSLDEPVVSYLPDLLIADAISPTIRAVTATVRSARALPPKTGWPSVRPSCCRYPIIMWSSPCRRRSPTLPTKTRR